LQPILFELFGYPVKTYGVFVSLAHVVGICGMLLIVRRRHLPLGPCLDMVFVVLIAGLLGGRLGFWLEHPSLIHSPKDFFSLDQGGLSFFGGLALAFPSYLAYLLARKLPVFETSDLFAPLLPLSLAILRLGCFGAGCCHGLPSNLPWAVSLSSPLLSPSLRGVPIHPTQLYESAFLFLLAAALLQANFRKAWPAGMVATFCMGAYGIYRFSFDSLRGDINHDWPLFMSTSQALALLLVALAAFVAGYLVNGEEEA
jgi:phosphatidylglycerol:prolipoprotein diacylglycerol transferase